MRTVSHPRERSQSATTSHVISRRMHAQRSTRRLHPRLDAPRASMTSSRPTEAPPMASSATLRAQAVSVASAFEVQQQTATATSVHSPAPTIGIAHECIAARHFPTGRDARWTMDRWVACPCAVRSRTRTWCVADGAYRFAMPLSSCLASTSSLRTAALSVRTTPISGALAMRPPGVG